MITKAQAIRNVTRDDPSIDNFEIKRRIKEQYDLDVETNQINNTVGAYQSRRYQGEAHKTLLKVAKGLVDACQGKKRLAVQMVNTVKD